jgi:Lrp/AsnC family leucine-responsive transcriptional regulator
MEGWKLRQSRRRPRASFERLWEAHKKGSQAQARKADELADVSGVSPSTALRRLKRLRDAGVIKAEVAVLDPRKVGKPLHMIVAVRLERDDGHAVRVFIDQIRRHPAVTQCYFVTGSADYVLHMSVSDMDEFNEFVQQKLIANPHVAATETNVVIKAIKAGLAIPIED